ncbi:MAG TPA: hypothetical protein PLD47_16475 [Aggregatilineales bacterium]|nr:hypothetical protein [Anaerolineales bacterium]HRE49323.1 hypothetical protein [Aggregatilineales bacterium]
MVKRPLVFALMLTAAALLIVGAARLTHAQGGTPPAEFNEALKDLGTRLGRTLALADFDNPTSRWEWRGVDFADSSLECPLAGEVATPGKVIGYQFIFVLRGKEYDYRVAFGKPDSLKLCTNPTGAIYELTAIPTNPPRTDPPDTFNLALQDLGTRVGKADITLADFDQPRYSWKWAYREFRNSQLECPKVGVTTDGIVTPGWVYTFVWNRALYEYRAADVDTSNWFLCKAPAQ